MQRSARRSDESSVDDNLFSPHEWDVLTEALRLSGRERQIVEALCDGLKDAGIAERLGMPKDTVRSHLTRLHRKLRVSGRVELVVHLVKTHRRITRPQVASERPVVEIADRYLTPVRGRT